MTDVEQEVLDCAYALREALLIEEEDFKKNGWSKSSDVFDVCDRLMVAIEKLPRRKESGQ